MRVSVKGYLAMLVGVFLVGLLAVSPVNRNLAGNLGGKLDDISHHHWPLGRRGVPGGPARHPGP